MHFINGVIDTFSRQMHLRNGEKLIDRLDTIEDTKGNNGERGSMFYPSSENGIETQDVMCIMD